jgi:hypothetical protein
MFRQNHRPIDMNFLDYLTAEDLEHRVTLDRIKRLNKTLAKDEILVYSYYLETNKDMCQGERTYCENYLKFLKKEEERKFIKAIHYIEECQHKQTQQEQKTD